MKEKTKRPRKLSNLIFPIVALLIFVVGAGIFLYPAVSNWLAEQNHAQVIRTYDEELAKMNQEEMERQWQLAREYNENLAGDPLHDPFLVGSGYAIPDNYEEVLNVDGVMGYLEIPKIDLKLPIYHGTSEEVLQKGVGHLEQTALPIGGEGYHSVLTGHRGLPSAELFTRLDEMEVGDYFYIHVLDETLAYKVDQITTILPEELQNLSPEEGKDLVTLLTCTPYSVNTHRLLVRGQRTEYIPPEETVSDVSLVERIGNLQYYQIGILIGAGILLILLLIFIIRKLRKKKKGEGNNEE